MGVGKYELKYIRTRDRKETDFLIVKDNKPWFLVDSKLKSFDIARHHYSHSKQLGGIPIVQVVMDNNVLTKKKDNAFLVSASRFF